MRSCTLIRLDYKTVYGTFGVFLVEGKLFCCTLELPFLYNTRSESCIPIGTYHCKYHIGRTKSGYLLLDVPERSGIMIHAGNSIEDSEGCILLGEHRAGIDKIVNSREPVARLARVLEKKDFMLTVEEYRI